MSKNIKRWGIRLEGVLKVLQAGLATALVAGGMPWAEAADARQYALAIPRQPLDAALKAFAEQTGLQVGHATDIDGNTPIVGPLNGLHTAEQALELLLAGQGLRFRRINDR